MATKSHSVATFLVLVGGIFLIVLASANGKTKVELVEKPTLIAPKNLKDFALGYNEVVADSLWLRAIQDFDFCENADPLELDAKKKRCSKGWVFHMVDAITELAPNFRKPYFTGAMMLSVLVNDIAGASVIFDRSVERFPNDAQILFNAAYQAMIEEKNPEKASKLLIRAGKNGAPPWVFSLASRLQERVGQLRLAQATLKEALSTTADEAMAKRLQERLVEIEKELSKQKPSP